MATFIKAGFWEKLCKPCKGYKGWLNLDELIQSLAPPAPEPSYKVYTALLTQEGINDPVATVLENTLGGDIVWSYESLGLYIGTLTDAFPEDKTAMFITSTRWNGDAFMCMSLYGEDIPNAVAVETLTLPTYTSANDLLYKTSIEIRVYN